MKETKFSGCSVNGKLQKLIIVLAITILVSTILSIFGNTAFLAYAEDVAMSTESIEEVVKVFTNSDYLYDAVNQIENTSYKIKQYNTLLAGKKVGNDDYIVQIVPREYFYNSGIVTKIGKEYGFFIKTEKIIAGYRSHVLVFDIDIGMNQHENELTYSVKPLFKFQYVSSASGITLEFIADDSILKERFFLKNVCFGYSFLMKIHTIFRTHMVTTRRWTMGLSFYSQDIIVWVIRLKNGKKTLAKRGKFLFEEY